MPTDIQIIPAILATTEEEYKSELEKISSSPELADGWVQIDLMDGKFVDNTSVGLDVLEKYPLKLQTEVHLMVRDPINWIEKLVQMGVKRIVIHQEAENVEQSIERIKAAGLQVGVALNPETPVEKLEPFVGTIDVVLLMSVRPGFEGQEFIPETLEKVGSLSKQRGKFRIEVDGGIDRLVVKDLVEAGADNLIIGSHLIDGNITENLEEIWESLRA